MAQFVARGNRSLDPKNHSSSALNQNGSLALRGSILQCIGQTPLIRLTRSAAGLKAQVLAKLEYLNPGGSIKDRVGVGMIEAAEKAGLIKPGYTIVEPTSGNTGVGLALGAAVKGYKLIFTVPDKMSNEKIDLLRAYGAKVIVTPTAVPPNHPSHYVQVAKRIVETSAKAFMPNQYFNPANPEVHYNTTGPEIWAQTGRHVDFLVAGMGTGGTITGTGRYLKEKNPRVKIVGVDPEGSMLRDTFYGTTGDVHTYRVEGIGEDFVPSTLDLKVVDEVITVSDKDAFLMARRLAREEGLLCGGSSGAAAFAALKVAEGLPEDKTVVVILPDTGRNYLNKIYSDEWMKEHDFLESGEERIAVTDLLRRKSRRVKNIVTASPQDSVGVAVDLMKEHGISQLPVIQNDAQVGSIRDTTLMRALASKEFSFRQRIEDIMEGPLQSIDLQETIMNPMSFLKEKNAFVVTNAGKIMDIIATIDVVDYLIWKETSK